MNKFRLIALVITGALVMAGCDSCDGGIDKRAVIVPNEHTASVPAPIVDLIRTVMYDNYPSVNRIEFVSGNTAGKVTGDETRVKIGLDRISWQNTPTYSQVNSVLTTIMALPTVAQAQPERGNRAAPAGSLPAMACNLPATAGNLPAMAGNLPAMAGNLPATACNFAAMAGNFPAMAGKSPAMACNLAALAWNLPAMAFA